MKLAILLFFISISAFANIYTLTGAQYNNGEEFQGSIIPGDVYKSVSLATATTLGLGIISARAIQVCAQSKGVHIRFSSDATSATLADHMVLGDTCQVFGVLASANRISVIEDTVSAAAYVTILK